MRGSSLHPGRFALLIAAAFWAVGTAYVLVSTLLVARVVESVENSSRIELLKGLIFILLASIMLFWLSLTLLARVRSRDLQLAQRDAALLLADRRAFAANVAAMITHDINNYLTIGLATSDRLAVSSGLNDAERKLVDLLRTQCRKVTDLTKRLQRLGHQEISNVFEPVELESLVRETIDFIRHHPKVTGCDVRVGTTEAAEVEASPTMMQQILTNLILNAAQASEGGGRIELDVSLDEGTAVLAVNDDGPGVPAQERERIFNIFHSTKRDGGGIGLASAKACIESHGGRISVGTSRLGGARFEIRLPLRSVRR